MFRQKAHSLFSSWSPDYKAFVYTELRISFSCSFVYFLNFVPSTPCRFFLSCSDDFSELFAVGVCVRTSLCIYFQKKKYLQH